MLHVNCYNKLTADMLHVNCYNKLTDDMLHVNFSHFWFLYC